MSRQVHDPSAISIISLTKKYGRLTAVSDLNLQVPAGEVFGFLGLNGAGKTTTIRILLDLLRPTKGRAMIFGYDCQSESLQTRKLVGYMPGELGIYLDLTGREVLAFLGGLGGSSVAEKYRAGLMDRLRFAEVDQRRKLREYSAGMKRKLGLLQALQADSPLLILDEPTEGLDPLIQESFYKLLGDLRSRGRTVFMSSHVLSEVERVCDRIAVLRQGKLVLLSPVEELRRLAPRRVRVCFSKDVPPPGRLPTGHEIVAIEPRMWSLKVEGRMAALLWLLERLPVEDLETEEARLEDVLLNYY